MLKPILSDYETLLSSLILIIKSQNFGCLQVTVPLALNIVCCRSSLSFFSEKLYRRKNINIHSTCHISPFLCDLLLNHILWWHLDILPALFDLYMFLFISASKLLIIILVTLVNFACNQIIIVSSGHISLHGEKWRYVDSVW